MSEEIISIKKNNNRLGKGLSALLGDMDKDMFSNTSFSLVNNPEKESLKGYLSVNINQIVPNKLQPRKFFASEELEELANSIRENGVLQPILVRKIENDKFEIIAGERRFRASLKAGLAQMPCIIRDLNDEQVFVLAVIENIQRENLNPLEEAESYLKLVKEFRYTQEEVGKLVHKSRSHISNIIRLTNLPQALKDMVMNGQLTGGHVRPLLALDSEEQMINIAEVIIQNNYSVRKVEELVNLILSDEEKLETLESNLQEVTKIVQQKGSEEIANFIMEFSKAFQATFELPVKIKPSKKGGVISIKYQNQEDLEKIIQKINGEAKQAEAKQSEVKQSEVKQNPFTIPSSKDFLNFNVSSTEDDMVI